MKKLSDQDAKLIRYVYAQGLKESGLQKGERVWNRPGVKYISMKELAAHYGVSICTISHLLNGKTHTGAPRRETVMPPRPPGRTEKMRQLWREGWTARQIAQEFGITRSAVWHAVRRTPAPPKQWTRRSRRLLATTLAATEAT